MRSLSRSSARPCSRPGCAAPATATLGFSYHTREAWLGSLAEERLPETYDLCRSHADRTRPPHAWQLVDRRPVDEGPDGDPEGVGGEATVAVLAAALRAVPDPAATSPALGVDEGPSETETGDPDEPSDAAEAAAPPEDDGPGPAGDVDPAADAEIDHASAAQRQLRAALQAFAGPSRSSVPTVEVRLPLDVREPADTW